MTTLNLEASKKVYELLGDTYDTEASEMEDCSCVEAGYESCEPSIPKPNFSELIRLLPKIGEKKGWKEWVNKSEENGEGLWNVTTDIVSFYQESPTEEQGMEEVSKYLLKIL